MASFAYSIIKKTKQTIFPTNIVNVIPDHYKALWNKIPADFISKIGTAVNNKTITLEDVLNLKKDVMRGIFMFQSAGFSLTDALALEKGFGSDDSTTSSDGNVSVPQEIDIKYKAQWQKIPENLRSKLTLAIENKKISSDDLNHCISTLKRGISMLESIGLSNKDAVELGTDISD